MHDQTICSNRFDIRPFPRVATYPTGWAGYRTFAEIMEDCTPLAATLIRKHGIAFQDFPDALQRGFMVVWERLAKDTQMFAHADKYIVARIVEANCGTNYWRRHDRHLSLDALEGVITEDHPDEWMITGLEANRSEVWAAWATAADMRIDIERIFARLVAKYEAQPEPHRFRYIVALYYVTTQVKLEDAALIAGINHHYLLDDYASIVRKDVQQAFGELYRPGLRWIDKFKRGHQTPALLVLEKYQRNPRMIYAIRSLLEEQPPTEARLQCPWPNNNQYRAKAHKALMKAYGCSA
ncbi:MAG: hypothetical protein IPK17_13200 [Chloroflexi bacterium]|mgnify:FL=1|uniref:hypothetical protein n=1 Tax=Candidatus Flexifilum breve TaxID=3140694 RepID=UPI003134D13C|nr:hypothetical protein [Chloroflexota bacterium]